MKVKVSELSGAALDWAVAKCEGHEIESLRGDAVWYWLRCSITGDLETVEVFQPSSRWEQSGPIIHQKQITTLPPVVRRISKARHAFPVDYWRAMIQKDEDELAIHSAGPTPLIAAMRCYVASKLGEEVDIPEELV